MTSNIRNPFDAPIAGQSLTDKPGNNKWEHPAQYSTVEEASEAIWELLHESEKLEQILLLLHTGVSVEALAKGVLFSGFTEGKWTPDLAVLLAEIVFNQILTIGMKGKIKKMRILIGDHTNTLFKKNLADFNVSKDREIAKKQKTAITEIKEDIKELPKMGLMAGGQ